MSLHVPTPLWVAVVYCVSHCPLVIAQYITVTVTMLHRCYVPYHTPRLLRCATQMPCDMPRNTYIHWSCIYIYYWWRCANSNILKDTPYLPYTSNACAFSFICRFSYFQYKYKIHPTNIFLFNFKFINLDRRVPLQQTQRHWLHSILIVDRLSLWFLYSFILTALA